MKSDQPEAVLPGMIDSTQRVTPPASTAGGIGSEPVLRAAETNGRGTRGSDPNALSGTLDLKTALDAVLEVLRHHHGILRSTVTLIDADTEDLRVEAGLGLTSESQAARYRLGEGITGRVVKAGKRTKDPRGFTEIVESRGFLHESRGWSRGPFPGFGELNSHTNSHTGGGASSVSCLIRLATRATHETA